MCRLNGKCLDSKVLPPLSPNSQAFYSLLRKGDFSGELSILLNAQNKLLVSLELGETVLLVSSLAWGPFSFLAELSVSLPDLTNPLLRFSSQTWLAVAHILVHFGK